MLKNLNFTKNVTIRKIFFKGKVVKNNTNRGKYYNFLKLEFLIILICCIF